MPWIFFICVLLLASGCRQSYDAMNIHQQALSTNDLKTLVTPPDAPKSSLAPRKKNLSQPRYPDCFYRKASLVISRDIPLTKVIEEMARAMGINAHVETQLTERIAYRALDRSYLDILQDLCRLLRMRFSFDHNTLFIERDTPYAASYNVQFLNFTRNSHNRISVATDIFGSGTSGSASLEPPPNNKNGKASANTGSNSMAGNGSDSHLSVQTHNDFWSELEHNLTLLLHDPNETNPKESPAKRISFHKQGGLLTVFTTAKNHEKVRTYLESLRLTTSSQVLIEAKIIESSKTIKRL